MKKILTNYLVFIFLVSCGQDDHWQTLSPKGLEGKFNDIKFINDSTGWIGGSKMEMSLKNQDAVVYKTTDGGHTWTPKYIGKGSVKFISYVHDTLFAIKHVFTKDSYEDVNSVLIKSMDRGQNWNEVAEIPGITKHVTFANPQIGYLIAKNKESNINDWKLLKTKDGGLTWTFIRLVDNVQSGLLIKNSFFINQHNANALLVFDIEKESLFLESLPKDFESELIIKDNKENLWVVGSDSHDFVLLKREGPKKFQRIKFDMIKGAKPYDFYTQIDIKDNVISLITGDGESVIGVTKRFFISQDLGKSWTEEKIPFDLSVEPLSFDVGKIWSYYGIGLQIRDARH